MPFFIFFDIYVTHSMCICMCMSIHILAFSPYVFHLWISLVSFRYYLLLHTLCTYIFRSLDNFRFLDSFSHWLTDHVSRSNTHTLFNKFDLYSDQIILLNKWVELKRSCTKFPKTRFSALFHSFIAVSFANLLCHRIRHIDRRRFSAYFHTIFHCKSKVSILIGNETNDLLLATHFCVFAVCKYGFKTKSIEFLLLYIKWTMSNTTNRPKFSA